MRIRRITLLVACCLMLAIASACSGGSGGTGGNEAPNKAGGGQNEGAANANSQPAQTEATKETPAKREMDFDLGGKTIKLVSWYDESIKGEDPDSLQMQENLKALMEKHNFNLEYVIVDYGEIADKVSASLIAGDPIGDIIRMARPWMIPSLTKQGLFWPLDEYVTNENAFRLQYTKTMSEYEGKGYGFRVGGEGAASGIVYNRTLMNELGLKPLQQYVDEGNWTWDTFIEVAKQANRDTNNDGKIDTWGLSTDSLLPQALAANDAALVRDGKQMLEDPRTLETLNFLSKLATEKISRPTEGGDWQEPTQFFLQGNTLMNPGQDYTFNEWQTEMKDFELGFVPFPQGPSADGYRTFLTIPNYYTIPRSVENPEQLVYIIEKIYDIESFYDYRQQAAYETFFSKEEDLNNALIASKVINIVEQDAYYPSMPYYEFLGEIREGVSISTVIEKYKPAFQSAIDEVWGK